MPKVIVLQQPAKVIKVGRGGPPGPAGPGVAAGGNAGQVLRKVAGDFNTAWSDAAPDTEKVAGQSATTVISRLGAVEAGQASGVYGYATRALMDADLTPPDKAIAYVTNDATAANNGTWRKSGASGGGSWVQSSFDRVAVLEQTTEKVVQSTKNLFNPAAVITGYWYSSTGTQANNATRRVSAKMSVTAGQKISISGLNADMLGINSLYTRINFWDGETHIATAVFPATNVNTDYIIEGVPAGATSVSINLPDTSKALPSRLQVEVASKPTSYQPYLRPQTALAVAEFDANHYERSSKNLFDGQILSFRSVSTSWVASANEYSVTTGLIPVEPGKTYTVSGLDPTLGSNLGIIGVGNVKSLSAAATETFVSNYASGAVTFTVANPGTCYVVIELANSTTRWQEAFSLKLQLEEGSAPTGYEPPLRVRGIDSSLKILEASLRAYTDEAVAPLVPKQLTTFESLGVAGPQIAYTPPTREFGPFGPLYNVDSDGGEDAKGATLFALVTGLQAGTRSVYAHLCCRDAADAVTTPKVTVRPFTVPSGQLVIEGPGGASYAATNETDDYVHPGIAYDAAGVAGYKYWMISSILPGYSTGGALWEDEDIFVSNDAQTWLRIRSAYEADRPDTAPGLVLPPHDLVAAGGRRYGFLPCPAAGDVIEISVPADNGGAQLNNVNITLTGLPWKHDPAILIDGGYVYIYHTYHLSYADRDGGKNRFIVCTRTNDGVNWECVRSDGSTLSLESAAAARQMFTKDGSGRYNYLYYTYNTDGMNPAVLKYGAGDYEFVYGANFTKRFKGTTPFAFDFSTTYQFHSLASDNHPGLLLSDGTLYLLNEVGAFQSADRGVTFTSLAHYPLWRGGLISQSYKKALCVGDGGKVIVADVASLTQSAYPAAVLNQFKGRERLNKMHLHEFASVAAFAGYGATGLGDGYIDLQIDQLNYAGGSRKTTWLPYRGNASTTTIANVPHQRVKLAELTIADGDALYIYISLNARAGGSVSFNGLEIG